MPFDFEAFKAYIESDGEIEFDLYARDPGDYAELAEIVPGLVVSSAGGSMPFQAEGLIEGYPFYYRDEQGGASLRVGSVDGERPYLGESTLWSASENTEDGHENEDFPINLLRLIKKLKRSPFPYEFEGYDLDYLNDGSWNFTVNRNKIATYGGWGYNPEEAYQAMFVKSEYLEEHGCSEVQQLAMMLAHEFKKEPINADERIYPEISPGFIQESY